MKVVKQITMEVVEHVTVRTLLERYKASQFNSNCMHGLTYVANIADEPQEFTHSWGWLSQQPPDNKLYVIDDIVTTCFLT